MCVLFTEQCCSAVGTVSLEVVLFMEAISAFISSHPEADFRPRLTLREVLRSLCAESKMSESDFLGTEGIQLNC